MKIEGLLHEQPDGAGHLRRPEPRDAQAAGPIPTRSSGTPSATRASSSPRCRTGGGTACSAFTINLQGGSPQGYSKDQPWHNSAFTPTATLRPDYLARLERILDRADELGMVVDPRLLLLRPGPAARGRSGRQSRRLTRRVDWLLDEGLRQRAGRGRTTSATSRLRPRDPAAAARPRADRARAKSHRPRRPPAARQHQLRRRHDSRRENVVPRVRLPAAARQRRRRPGPHRRDGPQTRARSPGYRADADPVQRGRPLRLRQAAEQLHRGARRSTPRGATSTTA